MIEFSLIDKYFKNKTRVRDDVILGIGDDGALLQTSTQQLMVVVIDTMVAGVHFPFDTHPFDIGYKALAVNLSDLAAMGATPAWFTLALTMPNADAAWLENFSAGLFQLANQFNMQLVGGDTTRGPLTITIQAHGFVPSDLAIRRDGAKAGDKIYVSNTLGDAGLGLMAAMNQVELSDPAREFVLQRLNRPVPRVELGLLLRKFASAAIDISDGFAADLQHILTASKVGAEIFSEKLPVSSFLRENLVVDKYVNLALTAGDDYELCFTVPAELDQDLQHELKNNNYNCTCVGVITADVLFKLNGKILELERSGYLHFKPNDLISAKQS